jgi:hypothetical protein
MLALSSSRYDSRNATGAFCQGVRSAPRLQIAPHPVPVSFKGTSICIVDDTGRIVREVKVSSQPEALLQVLSETLMGAPCKNAG